MTLRALWDWWKDVWFAPKPVTAIALYRILFGLLVLQHGFMLWPDLLPFFGKNAIVSSQTALQWANGPTLNVLNLLPQNDEALIAAFRVYMLAALFLTLGLFTRMSAAIVFLGLISLTFRNPFVFHSGDCFMRAAAFLLMLSPCGEAFSLDNLIKIAIAPDPTRVSFPQRSPWAQRLLQFNLAAVYADAFWTKIMSHQWLDGLSVYYATRLDQFKRLPVTFLFNDLWACKLATWSTLAIELSMWTLVWFRELRYWILAAALLFHLGLDWALNIPLFQLVMLSALIVFVDPADLAKFMDAIKRLVRRTVRSSIRVTFDGDSTASLRTAEILRRLDVFGLIEFTDLRLMDNSDKEVFRLSANLVRVHDGDRLLDRLDAWRDLSSHLPLLWIFYPVLALPGIGWLANRFKKPASSVLESR